MLLAHRNKTQFGPLNYSRKHRKAAEIRGPLVPICISYKILTVTVSMQATRLGAKLGVVKVGTIQALIRTKRWIWHVTRMTSYRNLVSDEDVNATETQTGML